MCSHVILHITTSSWVCLSFIKHYFTSLVQSLWLFVLWRVETRGRWWRKWKQKFFKQSYRLRGTEGKHNTTTGPVGHVVILNKDFWACICSTGECYSIQYLLQHLFSSACSPPRGGLFTHQDESVHHLLLASALAFMFWQSWRKQEWN